MQNPTQTNYFNRVQHRQRVMDELKQAGVSWLGLLRMESRYLPQVIHPNEHIGGVVYGHNGEGSVMLVATDRRVIFLDKKPLLVNEDEISYFVVAGVNFSHAGLGTTVTLHTRVKDFVIHSFNQKCAQRFVKFIESRSLEHQERRGYDNYTTNGFL